VDLQKLTNVGPPCFFAVDLDDARFFDFGVLVQCVYSNAVVRGIRGRKSKMVAAFFDEVSAVLQFPLYFGENWNAFNDCITDLDWLVSDAYILLISSPELLLHEAEREDLAILLRSLARANESWVLPPDSALRDRHPTGFHVVFQGLDRAGRIARILAELDMDVEYLPNDQ
jgi:hypothetical protein